MPLQVASCGALIGRPLAVRGRGRAQRDHPDTLHVRVIRTLNMSVSSTAIESFRKSPRISAGFLKNLQNFARFLQEFAGFSGFCSISAGYCSMSAGFCGILQDFCRNLHNFTRKCRKSAHRKPRTRPGCVPGAARERPGSVLLTFV